MHLSIVLNSAEILVLGPHQCTRIWVRAMIDLLKKPSSICQSRWNKIETLFRYLVESVGAQNKDIGVASQTLLTDVKLRLRRRLLGRLASFYALGHYFQVGLAGRAQALFCIYDQTDALYDPLSGRKTLTLP